MVGYPIVLGPCGVRLGLGFPYSHHLIGFLGGPILGGMGVPCVGSLHVVGVHCSGSREIRV